MSDKVEQIAYDQWITHDAMADRQKDVEGEMTRSVCHSIGGHLVEYLMGVGPRRVSVVAEPWTLHETGQKRRVAAYISEGEKYLWSREMPTESGWYFIKRHKDALAMVDYLELSDSDPTLESLHLAPRDVEFWAGPIPEPAFG